MQNLHRHTSYSNILTAADSTVSNEDYAKRAVELGHKVISSVEHGWQGYYFETYELAKKYNLKAVIGTEAYWVKDRQKEYKTENDGKISYLKDRSNHHILLCAKSNQGREAINDILSEANITGYYYKPRIDIELIMSLPPKDVFLTSACIAFSGYDDIDDIILQFHDHFQENFMLEQQYHLTERQKNWNKHLLQLAEQHNIPIIAGLDSHFILPEQSQIRDYLLEARDTHYDDEYGWFMDYPDDETTIKRFKEQGILSDSQIKECMDNTDIALDFCDYDNVRIFMKDIKLPSLYPDKTVEEKEKIYEDLIVGKAKEYLKNIPKEEWGKYVDGIKAEIQTYKDTGMCDYPLLDYEIVKDAVENGGEITDTGRGSAVGFFTNTLCGFSKIDRFKSAIKLYPERFISTTRILSTKSLPDIDLNVGTPEIFEESQKKILGENHACPMIAFGTLKKKSAFKIYSKARNMNFELSNQITQQIGTYEEALKNAEDDEKDEIDIYDYINEQYKEYIEGSEEYWGVISDKKKAPSAYLLYDGDIRREIGLIKCKSETTNKEYITCVIDGAIAENYKFLKNDILKVDVVNLINKVFKRIGVEHFDVNTLIEKTKDDPKVWDLYANGYTIGLNQVEKESSKKKCMTYKPKNISELSAFVAAIRPGFKSMYTKFENRESFSYGIPTLDKLLQTEELPVSFIFFQEQVMSVLNYAGFPMDECYGIIKAIAKKHPEKVKPLKQRFVDGFRDKLIEIEQLSQEDAQEKAEEVWTIINDNCGYSFNASHAFCMGCDSLYQAWQKANYPYEFYEVLLQHFSDKGKKDKVALLKSEMQEAFNIKEGTYKFGEDNRRFVANKEDHCIYPSLSSIKGISQTVADDLYELGKNKYDDFINLLIDLKETSCKSNQLDILIKLEYFSKFGSINMLLKQVEVYSNLKGRKQIKLADLSKYNIPLDLIQRLAQKQTAKMFKDFDWLELVREMCKLIPEQKTSIVDILKWEQEYLGYMTKTIPNAPISYYFVTEINNKYKNVILTLYRLYDKKTRNIKVKANTFDRSPIEKYNVISIDKEKSDRKWRMIDGKWTQIDEWEDILERYTRKL